MKLGYKVFCFLGFFVGAAFAGQVTVIEAVPGETLPVESEEGSRGQTEVRVEVSPTGEKRHVINREIVHPAKPATSPLEEVPADD